VKRSTQKVKLEERPGGVVQNVTSLEGGFAPMKGEAVSKDVGTEKKN